MTTNRPTALFGALTVLSALGIGALAGVAPVVPIVILGLIAVVAATWQRPKAALTLWLLSVCMVPYWVGTGLVAGFIPLASMLGILFVTMAIMQGQWRPQWWDLALFVFIGFGYLAVAFGSARQGEWFAWISHWAMAFMVGRVLVPAAGRDFTTKAVAVVFGIVGACASVEFLLSFHPFVDLAFPNKSFGIWHSIQSRGNFDRSEWAFGHSISLGSSLAMAIPFAMAANFRWRMRLLLVALIVAGIVFSLSRSGLVVAAVTIGLALVFQSGLKTAQRVILGAASAVTVWVIADNFTSLIGDATEDTSASSLYRVLIYQNLVDVMQMFGRSTSAVSNGDTIYYNGFRSIDSAFLFLGLAYGWIFPAVLLIAFAGLILRAFTRKTSPAEIALLGTLPALATVSLITQYQMVVWFMAGVAVTFASKDRTTVEAVAATSTADGTPHGEIVVPTPVRVGAS